MSKRQITQDYKLYEGSVYINLEVLDKRAPHLSSLFPDLNIVKKNVLYEKRGNKETRYVLYSSLGKILISKLELPDEKYIEALLLDNEGGSMGGSIISDPEINAKQKELLLKINYAYNCSHRTYLNFYHAKGYDIFRRHQLSRTHAVVDLILQYKKKKGFSIGLIYSLLKELNFEDFTVSLNSPNYFSKWLKSAERNGIHVTLIHGNAGRPSNNTKINRAVKELILSLGGDLNKVSARETTQRVNTILIASPWINGARTLSISKVSDFLKQPQNKNIIEYQRLSKRGYVDSITPSLLVNAPEFPCDQFAIDGTKLQFALKDEDDKPIYMTLMTVIDNFSRRIMGYALGKSENVDLAMKALKMAILASIYRLPDQLIYDGGSAFKGDFKDRALTYASSLGVGLIKAKLPTTKGIIERSFKTLQSTVFNKYIGYIGEGIRSKSPNARPNEDLLMLLRKPEYLRNVDQIRSLLDEMIHTYNHQSLLENGLSPAELYREKPPKHSIKISPHQLSYMLDVKMTRKASRSTVTIKTDYERVFSTYEAELMLKTNNSNVDVYFAPADDKEAFIFKEGTDEFLGKYQLRTRVRMARATRTKADIEGLVSHLKKKKKALKDIKDKSEQIRKSVEERHGEIPIELINHRLDDKETMAYRELSEIMGVDENPIEEIDRFNFKNHVPSNRKGKTGRKTKGRNPFKTKGSLKRISE